MKETQNIEGTLENVKVFAWQDGRALVSRVTIDSGSFKTSIPYFGALTDDEIFRMVGKPARFTEYRRGLFFKEIDQELEGENICAHVGWLAASDAKAFLRAYYPVRK